MTIAVAGNEARNYVDVLVTNVLESLLHQFSGQVGINHMLALLIPGTDKVTRVHADTILHHSCDDVRRQTFAIRDDCISSLLAQVVNQVDTIEDTLQLVEELVYIIE